MKKLSFLLPLIIVFSTGCNQQREFISIQPEPQKQLDYQNYILVLEKYVENGLVKYCSLKSNPDLLNIFIRSLSNVGPNCTPQYFKTKNHHLAFWINVYNAAGMQAALRLYPAAAIKPDFQNNVYIYVNKKRLNLIQIAQLAKQAGDYDPRINLALVIPAKGAPLLPNQIYEPEKIDDQLNNTVKNSLDNQNLLHIDHKKQSLLLGYPLFSAKEKFIQNYNKKFNTKYASIINALNQYANSNQRRKLNSAIGYKIDKINFDRSLNIKDEPACALDNP